MLASRHLNPALSLHHSAVASANPRRSIKQVPVRTKATMDGMVERMAQVMIERRAADGNCTEADLLTAGFSQIDIDAFKSRARQQANAETKTKSSSRQAA